MADYVAERNDWDFATFEIGINMVREFEPEKFKKRVEYFIQRIARSHPDKWVFCIDMFTFYMDFDSSSEKQDIFRKVVRDTVKNLNMSGVVHIDGRKILKSLPDLTVDVVHPSPYGMEEMAGNLSEIIKAKLL